MTGIAKAAVEAYEPIQAREQEHQLKIRDERKKRAEGHFARVFGEHQEATVEGVEIVFTIDKKHRLAYTGNLREKKKLVGPGWAYLEKCAGCKQEQPVAFVQTLADLGRILTNGTPEWECPTCNPA
jgi:hypothetical protein